MPDDFDSMVADRCRAVDDVPVPAHMWSQVQFKVLDQPPAQVIEHEATMIDLEGPGPAGEQRKGSKRVLVAGLLAAAAVVAIALVVSRNDDATPADQPFPTVTVPPRRLPNAVGEQLAPGTYFVDEVDGRTTPRIFATFGAGWLVRETGDGWVIGKVIGKVDIGIMTLDRATAVYTDACHWEAGYHPGPVDTLDGLVAALTAQQGWAEVTAPSEISVDGYVGKGFQRTAPADMSSCTTVVGRNTRVSNDRGPHPDFRSWDNEVGSGFSWYYEPGEIETLWVLDLDGTIVVITAALWPEPPAGVSADFAADVLASIRIERA